MAKKLSTTMIQHSLKTFSDVTSKNGKDFGFTAGYYESMIARLLAQMPAAQQKLEMQALYEHTATFRPIQL